MKAYNLGFISDEDIYGHVQDTVRLYRRSINLSEFNENIADPIKLTFDAKVYRKSMEQVISEECFRQIDKSNTNRIGYFHQQLFNYAGNGWIVPKAGFDVENHARHIFVEMKNKHNTMNSASSQKTYMKMQNKLLEDDQAVCYLVEVISMKSKDEPWKVSIDVARFFIIGSAGCRWINSTNWSSMTGQHSSGFVMRCQTSSGMSLPTIVNWLCGTRSMRN